MDEFTKALERAMDEAEALGCRMARLRRDVSAASRRCACEESR